MRLNVTFPQNLQTSQSPFAAFPCPPTPSSRGIRGKPLRTGKRAGIPEVAGSPISNEAETEAQVPRRPPTAAGAGKPFPGRRQRRGPPSFRPSGVLRGSPAEGLARSTRMTRFSTSPATGFLPSLSISPFILSLRFYYHHIKLSLLLP